MLFVVVDEKVIAPASPVYWFEEVLKEKLSLEFPLVKMLSNLVVIFLVEIITKSWELSNCEGTFSSFCQMRKFFLQIYFSTHF